MPPDPKTPEETFAINVRHLRLANKWSQQETVERLAAHGIEWHQTTLAKTEAAARPLRLNEAVALSEMYGVSLRTLLSERVGREEITEMMETVRTLEERLQALGADERDAARARSDLRKALKDTDARAFKLHEQRRKLEIALGITQGRLARAAELLMNPGAGATTTSATRAEDDRVAAEIVKRFRNGEGLYSLVRGSGKSYGFIHRILTEHGVELPGVAELARDEEHRRARREGGEK